MANRKMIHLTHKTDGKMIMVDANSIKIISEDPNSNSGSIVVINENLVRVVSESPAEVEAKIEKFFKG